MKKEYAIYSNGTMVKKFFTKEELRTYVRFMTDYIVTEVKNIKNK